MASTSYLARVIYRELASGETIDNFDFGDSSGMTYKLMVKAKSIPSPMSAPNTVESTTLEDDTQTFEMGIKTSDSKQIQGNLEKTYFDELQKLAGKKLVIVHLYGTDGIGGVAKVGYVGAVTPSIDDVGGVDEILNMTATVVPSTAATVLSSSYTVVDNKDGSFTVTKA